MIPLSSKHVDRPMVRMIAYKRIATGVVSITAFVVACIMYLARKPAMSTETWALFVLFFGVTVIGGGWTFLDGLRTLRILSEPPARPNK
jgi:cytochrome bd-type quinol oxidase subunit 1